ncbi:LON peptidase N-terminal domain and RING finger protein 1 isoform X2 [Amia ocellicauda]|uniref:LON peptidase N-terminal domain and RING finger protein 1 isoform X2 n=1 Tax=Amia ocellicauda TaxID=2972642 RepID=UPI003464A92A
MSILSPNTEEINERGRVYLPLGSGWDAAENVNQQRLILQEAAALALGDHLKEAFDMFSAALRYGSVRPEQLRTLVDCVLRTFKKAEEGKTKALTDGGHACNRTAPGRPFDCPACHRFLYEPVTLACGHTYCKRCLKRDLLSKCTVCSDGIARWSRERRPPRTNVILCHLLEKCFPLEISRFKLIGDIEELCKRRQLEEALVLSNNGLKSDPSDMLLRIYRAEIHAGLQQYKASLKDLEALCMTSLKWPEILCDLLSPGCENVKVGLQEMALGSMPHLRSNIYDTGVLHLMNSDSVEKCESEPFDSSEKLGLIRARSLRVQKQLENPIEEEGLMRLSSAHRLFGQEKGALLKRKLSASEQGPSVIYDGTNKHKKQGETTSAGKCPTVPCKGVPKELLEISDFECSLCLRLFYEPVTTPCGHTFCKSCLERCLDHTPRCPLCKESLKEYLASRKYTTTKLLEDLFQNCLSEAYSERKRIHIEETQELSDLTKNVPVFVCTMAYPTVPCPLHVFEPRYRLMIRRCIETGTRQFGMCISDPHKGFVDYGCMLQIRSVHFLPDGRSVVDTIGGQRFRVLKRGMRDGYCIADIEYLEDIKVEDADELSKLQELHDQVYTQACDWLKNLKHRFLAQILQHFGAMPDKEDDIQATPNGPACCWWLLAVLPVDPRYQLSVLSMMSLKERLLKIQHILMYLQSIPNE